jgi:hypothetical protein
MFPFLKSKPVGLKINHRTSRIKKNPKHIKMINVSDSCFTKNTFDFEECTSMEIDCWPSKSEAISAYIPANSSSSLSHVSHDESVINIFTQSIEIFGSSMAPWPATGKSIQEQVAGIFITSESSCTKDETIQSRLEANKPQIQSKLRRSSGSRRASITRINEEFVDSQLIYSKLEPIPIVTVERKLSMISTTKEKDDEPFEAQKESNSRSSRLQNWLSSLYARNNSKTSTKDEESGFGSLSSSSFDQKPLKSILKNTSVLEVQKSTSIPESEAIKITSNVKPKKSIKIRFDNEVSVCETFHKEDYCRQSLDYVARQLTPSLALGIKKELNSVKQEMEVHDDSRHLTQFYLIK